MLVRVPNFDRKIGHFTFSQRYTFPADFATGSYVDGMTKCHAVSNWWRFLEWTRLLSDASSQRQTQSFCMAQLKHLPWNSGLAEKVCLGWRYTQMFPYCYRWTERPLTQRDSDFCDEHHYNLYWTSLEKVSKKEKAEEDTRSSCLGILEVLWWTK